MNKLTQLAAQHAEMAFDKILHSPWPETKQILVDTVIAGADAALKAQWIRVAPGQPLPKDRQKIIMAKRYRNPDSGVWYDDLIIADTYSEEDGFFYEDVWAWMPLPELPDLFDPII